ncbi:hypothetical protein CANCADRAFT_123194 [Tortispora caseinolytica NRRL Y-17796]|uniref:Ribosomal protein L9 domain-containing protein n=1 Tax=Tortispora caseinolytica NRRL Y-17796 TaxID=767744 RepID=A0A1E4THY2_9ASCO|nr:hypothetical protein CANCADRAFT_123194 [Tortispora caseinolytica NRRL Y-17796]
MMRRLFSSGQVLSAKRPRVVRVQLLKNVESFGHRGQILEVPSSIMRNFLYRNGRAAYLNEGEEPPIPVVSEADVAAMKAEQMKAVEAVNEVKKSVFTKTSLFKKVDNNASRKTIDVNNPAVVRYSLDLLQESLPAKLQVGSIDADTIAEQFSKLGGIAVDPTWLRFGAETDNSVDVTIKVHEDSPYMVKRVVQKTQ